MSDLNKSIDSLIASKTVPIINTLTAMESKVDANLKRMKKMLLDTCSVFEMCVDTEIGMMSVYARMIHAPKSGQTDECELQWSIEKVEATDEDGIVEEIKLNGWQTQAAIEILNNK